MEVLERQVRAAHRRLTLQKFFGFLGVSLFVCLSLAVGVLAFDRFRPLAESPLQAWVVLLVGLAAGVLVAAGLAVAKRGERLAAAIEIDRRYELKERISSTLALDSTERESPAGQALVADASRRIERLNMGEKFRPRPGRWTWFSGVPALAAFLVAWLIEPAINDERAKAGGATTAAQERQIKVEAKELRKKADALKKQANDKGLKDAEDLIQRIEQASKEVSESKDVSKEKTLIKFNDIGKDLEKRRAELGADQLKKQLDQLKNLQKGPADELAKSLKDGDFSKAAEALKKLQSKLDDGKLDPKSKQELAKQLGEMREKMQKMADAHKKSVEDLKKQVTDKKKAGKLQEATELEQQLAKLTQQSEAMKKLEKLAEKLGQCEKCLGGNGDKKEAQRSMDALKQAMDRLQAEMEEQKMLDQAMDEMSEAKENMMAGNTGKNDGKKPGDGMGRGRGQGDRPEEEGKTGFYDTKARTKPTKGEVVFEGMVDGPNKKGQVGQQIESDFTSVKGGEADPLTSQPLTKKYRGHSEDYFEKLRGKE